MGKILLIISLMFSVVMAAGCDKNNQDTDSSIAKVTTVTENTSVTETREEKESDPETIIQT